MVARHDLVTDPRVLRDLHWTRLGTSVLRRAVEAVTDAQLDDPSGLPGWDRRRLLAHVGYNARALARLVTWAATGVEHPMYASPLARHEEIELGASLNPEALRTLSEHAAIDLDVRWRDLPQDRWDLPVVTAQGRTVPASETVWMRCREVWLHAVDLDAGVRVVDVPGEVLDRLLHDVVRTWTARDDAPGLRLCWPGGEADTGVRTGGRTGTVSGSLPELVGWATGRTSAASLVRDGWPDGPAPRWI